MLTASKPFWQSKTFIINVLSLVVILLESQEWTNLVPQGVEDVSVTILAGVNLVLRYLTTKPVTMTATQQPPAHT